MFGCFFFDIEQKPKYQSVTAATGRWIPTCSLWMAKSNCVASTLQVKCNVIEKREKKNESAFWLCWNCATNARHFSIINDLLKFLIDFNYIYIFAAVSLDNHGKINSLFYLASIVFLWSPDINIRKYELHRKIDKLSIAIDHVHTSNDACNRTFDKQIKEFFWKSLPSNYYHIVQWIIDNGKWKTLSTDLVEIETTTIRNGHCGNTTTNRPNFFKS